MQDSRCLSLETQDRKRQRASHPGSEDDLGPVRLSHVVESIARLQDSSISALFHARGYSTNHQSSQTEYRRMLRIRHHVLSNMTSGMEHSYITIHEEQCGTVAVTKHKGH